MKLSKLIWCLFGWKYTDYKDRESEFASVTSSLHHHFVSNRGLDLSVSLVFLFFSFFFYALYPAFISLHAKDARLLVNERTVNYPREKEREREHLMFQRVKTIGSRNLFRYWKDDCHFAWGVLVTRSVQLNKKHIKYVIFKLIKKSLLLHYFHIRGNHKWILRFLWKWLLSLECLSVYRKPDQFNILIESAHN